MDVKAVRRRTQIGRVTVVHEEFGAGPPLVLLHGLAGSGRWWGKTAPVLAERFRVHAVDLVGFGHSRSRERFALADAAGYLGDWIDRLEIAPVALIGHSMGGVIAAELVADGPDRVGRLILVDAAVPPLARNRLFALRALGRSLRQIPSPFLPVVAFDAGRAGPRTLWSAAGQLLAAEAPSTLAAIAVPTLVVWGERDPLVPVASGRRLAAAIPNAEFVLLPSVGHVPMIEGAEAFSRVVLAFLEEAAS